MQNLTTVPRSTGSDFANFNAGIKQGRREFRGLVYTAILLATAGGFIVGFITGGVF